MSNDRMKYTILAKALLSYLFEDPETVSSWMKARNKKLWWFTPEEMIYFGGGELVTDLLKRQIFGVFH